MSDTGGAQIAEAALVLPIVFMLLFGIIWFGRAFNIYSTITYAAREGARVASTTACALCTAATGTPAANAANAVTAVLQASHINPGQIQVYTGAGGTPVDCGGGPAKCIPQSGITTCTNVELDATTRRRRRGGGTFTTVTGPTACGTTVSFQYPYQFYFPFTSLDRQQILLHADVAMQGEN